MMIQHAKVQDVLTSCIALVWLLNGLCCKILNLVPRHEQIVAAIVSAEYARILTICIGLGELLIAAWVWSRIRVKLNASVQIALVLTMNILEFVLVPELLLWGKYNFGFALLFMLIVYLNAFYFTENRDSL